MIVITGASDGLGLELAKLYKLDGKTVVNVSRRACEYADENLLHNLREGVEIAAASRDILKLNEPLEALINCAGVLSAEPIGSITDEEIERLMATNVKAPILLASNLIERIKKDGTDIVNVSSKIATRATADQAVYGASKWALRGFTANLREELNNYPSRVISFCPGAFKTTIFEKATGITDDSGKGEMMSAKDVAVCLKQLLELPKIMEVAEIVINRKNLKT